MHEDKKLNITKLAHSLKESAKMMNVSVSHVRNESLRGKLQILKSGKRSLILATELERYLSELPKQ